MYYNNRGNQQFYGTGCSLFGCLFALIIGSFVLQGSLYLFFRYFWVILLLGIIIWAFRRFTGNDEPNTDTRNDERFSQKQDWHRDFENRKNTSYHNVDRDFEEVEEEEDDEFTDF